MTSTGGAGNRIIARTADPSPADTHPLPRGLVARIIATTVVPLLVLAWLSWTLLAGTVGAGAPRIGMIVLVLAATGGITAGGWSIATLSRRIRRARSEELAESLRATIARQAADIANCRAQLEEARSLLQDANARLSETSFKDELTGLYNRRFFFVRLDEEVARHRRFGHPVAVVLFDLDGFKEVNDGQGHMIGDETLRAIGQALTRYSRGINVVARYGGDEFAILLAETPKEGARRYAERIRQLISSHPYGHGMHVTASFGVAGLPSDNAATAEDLVQLADEALYVAKRGGKNQVAGAPAVPGTPRP